jgi:hypothetical protein
MAYGLPVALEKNVKWFALYFIVKVIYVKVMWPLKIEVELQAILSKVLSSGSNSLIIDLLFLAYFLKVGLYDFHAVCVAVYPIYLFLNTLISMNLNMCSKGILQTYFSHQSLSLYCNPSYHC